MSQVRDAMVPEPPWLAAEATAQEAGVLLARPEVAPYSCATTTRACPG